MPTASCHPCFLFADIHLLSCCPKNQNPAAVKLRGRIHISWYHPASRPPSGGTDAFFCLFTPGPTTTTNGFVARFIAAAPRRVRKTFHRFTPCPLELRTPAALSRQGPFLLLLINAFLLLFQRTVVCDIQRQNTVYAIARRREIRNCLLRTELKSPRSGVHRRFDCRTAPDLDARVLQVAISVNNIVRSQPVRKHVQLFRRHATLRFL